MRGSPAYSCTSPTSQRALQLVPSGHLIAGGHDKMIQRKPPSPSARDFKWKALVRLGNIETLDTNEP